ATARLAQIQRLAIGRERQRKVREICSERKFLGVLDVDGVTRARAVEGKQIVRGRRAQERLQRPIDLETARVLDLALVEVEDQEALLMRAAVAPGEDARFRIARREQGLVERPVVRQRDAPDELAGRQIEDDDLLRGGVED